MAPMNLTQFPSHLSIIETLSHAAQEVQARQTLQTVFIQGASGMFKSDLIESFVSVASLPVIHLHGTTFSESYSPLSQAYEQILQLGAVREHLQRPVNEVLSDWRIALSTLATLASILPGTITLHQQLIDKWLPPTRRVQRRTQEEDDNIPLGLPELFTQAVKEIARLSPFVLAFDDAHLFDESVNLAFTTTLLPSLNNTSLLLIFLFDNSNENVESQLELFRNALRFSTTPISIHLQPLTRDEVATFLAQEIGPLPEATHNNVVAWVYTKTGGNYAQLRDSIAWIKAQGIEIIDAPGEIPSRAEFLLTFASFSPRLQELLQIASVQGRHFCLPVLSEIMGESIDTLRKILTDDENGDKQWYQFYYTTTVGENQLQWYRFRGTRFQEWLYNSLRSTEKQTLHRRTGAILEQLYSSTPDTVAEALATHFAKGGVPERAAFYYTTLARRANMQRNFKRGYELAEKGISSLAKADSTLHRTEYEKRYCHLLVEKSHGLQGTEQSFHAVDVLREAYNLATRLQDLTLKSETAFHLGEALLNKYRFHESLSYHEEALKDAISIKNWDFITKSFESVRAVYFRQGKVQEFYLLCDEIIQLLAEEDDPFAIITIAEIIEDKAWVSFEEHQHAQVESLVQQALDHIASVPHPEQYPEIQYRLHLRRAATARVTGNNETALSEAETAIRWAERCALRHHQIMARIEKARCLHYMGQINEAEAFYEATHTISTKLADIISQAEVENTMGFFYSHTGRKRKSLEMYQRSYEHRMAATRFYQAAISLNNVAAAAKFMGEFDRALTLYQQLLNEGISQDDKSRHSLSLNHIGAIYRVMNRKQDAINQHRQSLTLCREFVHKRLAVTLRYLGQAYLANNELQQAEDVLLEAYALYQKREANIRQFPVIQLYRGRLALQRGQHTDALPLLEEAIALATHRQDQVWAGTALLNKGLLFLTAGQPQNALKSAEEALAVLAPTESWRIADAHHLLARCYLATGSQQLAREQVQLAGEMFNKMGLFHRHFQVEAIELEFHPSYNRSHRDAWQVVSPEELSDNFDLLGN